MDKCLSGIKCQTIRVKKLLEQLSRIRFLGDFIFPLFSSLLRSLEEKGGIFESPKNRVLEICSDIFFPSSKMKQNSGYKTQPQDGTPLRFFWKVFKKAFLVQNELKSAYSYCFIGAGKNKYLRAFCTLIFKLTSENRSKLQSFDFSLKKSKIRNFFWDPHVMGLCWKLLFFFLAQKSNLT